MWTKCGSGEDVKEICEVKVEASSASASASVVVLTSRRGVGRRRAVPEEKEEVLRIEEEVEVRTVGTLEMLSYESAERLLATLRPGNPQRGDEGIAVG